MRSFCLVAVPASARSEPFKSTLRDTPDPYAVLDERDELLTPASAATRTTGCRVERTADKLVLLFPQAESAADVSQLDNWLWLKPGQVNANWILIDTGTPHFFRRSRRLDMEASLFEAVAGDEPSVDFVTLMTRGEAGVPDCWLSPLIVRFDLGGSSLDQKDKQRPFSPGFNHPGHGCRSQILDGEGEVLLISPELADSEYAGACFLYYLHEWRRRKGFPLSFVDELFRRAGSRGEGEQAEAYDRNAAILTMAFHALGGSVWIEPGRESTEWTWRRGRPEGINAQWLADQLGGEHPDAAAPLREGAMVPAANILGGDLRGRPYRATRRRQGRALPNADVSTRPLWNAFSVLAQRDPAYQLFVDALADLWERRKREPKRIDARAYYWRASADGPLLECDEYLLVESCLAAFLAPVRWQLSYARLAVPDHPDRYVDLLRSAHLGGWTFFRRMTEAPSEWQESLHIPWGQGWWEKLDRQIYGLAPRGTVWIEVRKSSGFRLGESTLSIGVLGGEAGSCEETGKEIVV